MNCTFTRLDLSNPATAQGRMGYFQEAMEHLLSTSRGRKDYGYKDRYTKSLYSYVQYCNRKGQSFFLLVFFSVFHQSISCCSKLLFVLFLIEKLEKFF